MTKIKTAFFLGGLASTLLLGGCSDPKITVDFRHEPDSEAITELAVKLANKGIGVTRKADTPRGLQLTVGTDLDKQQFEKAVEEVIEPLKWKPQPKSRLVVKITETSEKVLKLLSLETGQESSVLVDWNRADHGIFVITTAGDERRSRQVCGVRAKTEGVIPNLDYSLELAGGDPRSEIVKTLRDMMRANKATAEHEIELEGYTAEQTPWKHVTFFEPEADSGPESEIGEALFVFESCISTDDIYGYQDPYGLTGSKCHLTQSQCTGVIRKLSGGDFFGVTGKQLEGNVQSFTTAW